MAKVNPEIVPQMTPERICPPKGDGKTMINNPTRTIRDVIISITRRFSLNHQGSMHVINTGKVEKANNPTATLETWIAWKKVIQWIARTNPNRPNRPMPAMPCSGPRFFVNTMTMPRANVANPVRPRTIHQACDTEKQHGDIDFNQSGWVNLIQFSPILCKSYNIGLLHRIMLGING